MDLKTVMSPEQLAKLKQMVNGINKKVNHGRIPKTTMGKNDFLKILMTQLTHQDPTEPMDDKDFIGQMAQFSTLEQITNLNEGISKVLSIISRSQAFALIGKMVEIETNNGKVSGIVEEVTGGEFPQVLVNGQYYDFSSIERVKK